MVGVKLREVCKRVYGKAGARHSKLHIAGSEVKLILDGKFDHSEAIQLMCEGFSLFEWILRADDKPDLIQVRSVIKGLSDDQMTDMDGIETTEKEADFHGSGVYKLSDKFFYFLSGSIEVIIDEGDVKLGFKFHFKLRLVEPSGKGFF